MCTEKYNPTYMYRPTTQKNSTLTKAILVYCRLLRHSVTGADRA